ncbi:MAG: membrane protein insertase YidC [Bacteroidota bacterium]
MDRNSIIGLVLIGLILVGYSIFTKPARDAQMAERHRLDSIARVEQARAAEIAAENRVIENALPDSVREVNKERQYGLFAGLTEGSEKYYTLESDLLKIQISNLGARPHMVELKKYQRYDSLPVILFSGDSTRFDLQFFADSRRISTGDFYFTPLTDTTLLYASDDSVSLTMRMQISDSAYIDYIYTLYSDKYMLDFNIRLVGLDAYRTDNMQFNWDIYAYSTEQGYQNENNYTTLFYRFAEGDVESMTIRGKKSINEISETTRLQWIAFKQQFFSSVLISKDYFAGAKMTSEKYESGKFIRHFSSVIDLPFDRKSEVSYAMNLYFGPNHFTTLKKYKGLKLENLVTVGGSMIRWLNEFVIIPIFNWLSRFIGNYGIIILLLTIILKVALFPLTYRSYKSQAVMRVLKPQVDEINAKFPNQADAMKKQQATMDLYKKAGANPMGGCLPTLLQLPILYAMFRFFPTSIELRQEGFLWVKDLSTYDSILNLPFTIPLYGNHVSLFTILMTATTILSMKMTNQTASTNQMPGMKTMMYIMPVMFMFVLNSFSAALTYYYFLANVITIAQNEIFKLFTDEEAILKKINARKAKPVKKSGFQKRLEEMTKQQQAMMKNKK